MARRKMAPHRAAMRSHRSLLSEKWNEAFVSVLPITLLVLLLCFFLVPARLDIFMGFLLGAVLVVVGMGLFTLGTDLAMTPIGEHVGSAMTRSRKVWLILLVSFLVGIMVTMSEPDLQVLAHQVPGVPDLTLILCVSIGVGLFLVLSMLRILFRVPISLLLFGCYVLVFVLSIFIPREFLAVAFDSGGVTTGPMTVPFIMALGLGVSAIRSDRNAEQDSFGLIALASVGPILAVMLLGLIFRPDSAEISAAAEGMANNSVEVAGRFWKAFPSYAKEVSLALLPILIFFFVFQFAVLRLSSRELSRIGAGLLYTFAGLMLFLTGANVGFMPMGSYLGQALGGLKVRWLLIPIGMVIGFFAVQAEPAVHVLSRQVFELTAGTIPPKLLTRSLSVSVSISVGLAMARILFNIPILYMLIPGYAIALGLMPFVDPVFTGIAFDSGGVASGPMTATFLLPLALGACTALDGNPAVDAFGVVAMVAMTPLITIQCLGVLARIRRGKTAETTAAAVPEEIIE